MCKLSVILLFFFFQAEDGIRDLYVTGVQTCALPIWESAPVGRSRGRAIREAKTQRPSEYRAESIATRATRDLRQEIERSEERRVGKECRSGGAACHYKKKKMDRGVELTSKHRDEEHR